MANNTIKLSPKHGLNPTIPICFFCRKEKNEIALFGKIGRNDTEAPRTCLLDYEPCNECKKEMEKGITLIEATNKPTVENQPEAAPNVYPTGRWWVVSEDFIKNNMNDNKLIESILKYRKSFIEPEIMPDTDKK